MEDSVEPPSSTPAPFAVEEVPQVSVEKLRQEHPELYGQLLIAQEAVDDAGSSWIWVIIFLVVLSCAAVSQDWLTGLSGDDWSGIQHWTTYAVLAVGGLVLFVLTVERLERNAFLQVREALLRAMRDAGLSVAEVLAAIGDDDELEDVAERLKKDAARA